MLDEKLQQKLEMLPLQLTKLIYVGVLKLLKLKI